MRKVHTGLLTALALLFGPPSSSTIRADENETAGRFVSVPVALGGDVVSRLTQSVRDEFEQHRKTGGKGDFRIVFDFTPGGKSAASEEYEFCLKLAGEIRNLQRDGARTMAFVHGSVTRHSVLPVLACRQVVMSAGASIGPVERDPEKITGHQRSAYLELGVRLATNPDLIAKLFDENLAIVRRREGPDVKDVWVDYDRVANKPNAVVETLFKRGEKGAFNIEKAEKVGLRERGEAIETREALARAYDMPPSSLTDGPLSKTVVAWRIPVTGEVTGSLREKIERKVRDALAQKVNLIVLDLRCHDGSPSAAVDLAIFLAQVNKDREDRPLRIVGYVTKDASNTATIIALGCHETYMDSTRGKVPTRENPDNEDVLSVMGGFSKLLKDVPKEEQQSLAVRMEELATLRHHSPLLLRRFVERGDPIFLASGRIKNERRDIVTDRELTEDRGKPAPVWKHPAVPIPMEDGLVLLRGDGAAGKDAREAVPTAVSLGLARKSCTLDELYSDYGLSRSDVKVVETDWLDDLGEFLRRDWVRGLLIMIGLACLMIELKMPGVGLPGVIAALCFVLFFWSGSQEMGGQITWLAILLFLLGLVLLGVEIFVLPGFGVCGISGILLLLTSLGLVTYGKWPQDGSDWSELLRKLAPFGFSLMGSIVLAVVLVRYLPSIPFFNRLLLKPLSEGRDAETEPDALQAGRAALLGAIGIAATPLRPAGKVQFGEEYVDVVAEGSYVAPGTRVQVVEIEGNRVVVKAV